MLENQNWQLYASGTADDSGIVPKASRKQQYTKLTNEYQHDGPGQACNCTWKFYRTWQPVYRYADYPSTIRCVSNRKLVSRFRTGCHGLQVDTDRWVEGVAMDRGCLVCNSPGCVDDEQHFIFDCPAYSHVRVMHMNLFQCCCIVADFLSLCEPNACGGYL